MTLTDRGREPRPLWSTPTSVGESEDARANEHQRENPGTHRDRTGTQAQGTGMEGRKAQLTYKPTGGG